MAVAAAATGLVLTTGVTTSAVAEPADAPSPARVAQAVESASVPTGPALNEAVTVAADVPLTFAASEAPTVTPPPPPPPPVVVEPVAATRAEASVSRSAERTASGSSQSSAGAAAEPTTASQPTSSAAETETETETEPASAPAPDSSAGSSVLDVAAQYVGTPYAYGGTSPSGFDCSGFTQYVFAQVGISLPRTAAAQGAGGQRVSRSEARPGDLAVVSDGSHVGIYAGGNEWYDSPRPGKSVSKRAIWTSDVYFVRY
ncbi:C40 family peptidase [Pseudokineococcus sp. 1T1Z-3]|uniref:C40 family peptidase n=1 Tax=Pseudokineococcus sp. 1T1Z-3 TaxID=3132745 RepID=UPI0030A3C7BF